MEIEAEFDLYASIKNGVGDALQKQQEWYHQFVIPRFYNLKRAGFMPNPNTTDLVLNLGHPTAGYIWQVTHVVISQADPSVNDTTGKVFICAGKLPGVGQVVGVDAHDPFAVWTSTNNIPADASFNPNEFIVYHAQSLFAIFRGYTAGTQYAFHAQVVEHMYPDPGYPWVSTT